MAGGQTLDPPAALQARALYYIKIISQSTAYSTTLNITHHFNTLHESLQHTSGMNAKVLLQPLFPIHRQFYLLSTLRF